MNIEKVVLDAFAEVVKGKEITRDMKIKDTKTKGENCNSNLAESDFILLLFFSEHSNSIFSIKKFINPL